MNKIKEKQKITMGRKLGYAVGALGDSVGFNVFYFFFLFFLTDVAGIAPAVAGTISLIAVAWDGITDPIIGHLSDNSKSKFGRRRPFVFGAALPYAICMFLLFNNVDMSIGIKTVYFTLIAMLFWTAYTAYVIPYFALGAEMTKDFEERTSLRIWASVGIQVSVMIASAAPPMIVEKTIQAGSDAAGGWRNVGMLFGAIIFIAIMIVWKTTKGGELSPEEATISKGERTNIFKTIFQILSLKPSFPLIGSIVGWSLTTAMGSAGIVYLMVYNLEFAAEKQSLMFVIMTLVGMAWLPIISIMSGKIGKKRTYIITMAFAGTAITVLGFVGITSAAILILWIVLFAFGNSSFWTLYYAMMYDVSEVDEFVNGHRREGIVTALMALCQKIGAAVGTFVTGLVLSWGAYDGTLEVQPESALDAILYICTIIPGVIGVAAAFFALFYPITGERFKALSAALEARKEGKEYTTEGFEKLLRKK